MLPHPDDFNKYPEHVQSRIVEWAADSVKMQDEIIRHSMDLDAAESKRLDRAVEVDAGQIPRAQRGTILLNGSLIAGAIVSSVLGNNAAVLAFIGGLAAINAMTLFVNRGSSKGPDDKG